MRRTEVPRHTYRVGVANTQRRREGREHREREEAEKKQGKERGGIKDSRNSTVTDKRDSGQKKPQELRGERESEMDTGYGGEASTSPFQSRHKKGHTTNRLR